MDALASGFGGISVEDDQQDYQDQGYEGGDQQYYEEGDGTYDPNSLK